MKTIEELKSEKASEKAMVKAKKTPIEHKKEQRNKKDM